jgi:heterodisulfide reductase subunit A
LNQEERSMSAERRIGVYLTSSGNGAGLDLRAIADYAIQLPGVCAVRVFAGTLDPEGLAGQIRGDRLREIVIGADSPGFFKGAFSRALAEAGGDPEQIRLASFREHGAAGGGLNGAALDRAKAIVACAVHGVPFGLAVRPATAKVSTDTLVIGAGVAGIQASLEIADAGHKVHLVERRGTIGGHMAMFDKTFPTLDCAACILTPKMVAVGKHPNIDLMILSEVQEVSGGPGRTA